MLHRCPSLFCFEFLVNRANFLVPDRHFALLLDLKTVLDESCGGMLVTS